MTSFPLKRALLAAAGCLALGACASKQAVVPPQGGPSPAIENRLAEAANRAVEAQETLARVQVARTKPAQSQLDETSLPEELKRQATLDWSGPAHEAAGRIAALIGYDFRVTGNPPSIPPMIHVSVQDLPAAKALENIGYQSWPFGEVAVDPNAKRVEFRYLQNHQQPRSAEGRSPALNK